MRDRDRLDFLKVPRALPLLFGLLTALPAGSFFLAFYVALILYGRPTSTAGCGMLLSAVLIGLAALTGAFLGWVLNLVFRKRMEPVILSSRIILGYVVLIMVTAVIAGAIGARIALQS